MLVFVYGAIALLVLANAIVWTWVLLLELKLRPVIRDWERQAKAKGFIKGVPGDYWLRGR